MRVCNSIVSPNYLKFIQRKCTNSPVTKSCVLHIFQLTLENETQRADGRMEYIIPSLTKAYEAMFRMITLDNLRGNCVTRHSVHT